MENKGKLHVASIGAVRLAKNWDEPAFNSEEIKPIALVVIKLHLSETISQSVSQSVSQSEEKCF